MNYYLFQSRLLTHIAFWIGYYVFFGFIWAHNGDYFSSYFLEFILLPVRICATYLSIYWLVPGFLKQNNFLKFVLCYLALIIAAGFIQRVFTYYYYDFFLTGNSTSFFNLATIGRSIILVNSTVIFITALKVLKLWVYEKESNEQSQKKISDSILEIKADKRMYRVPVREIRYIESLGNYVTYHLNGKTLISYVSLTEVAKCIPNNFIRIHKSFIINKDFISSYNNEDVELGDQRIPVGRVYKNQLSRAF